MLCHLNQKADNKIYVCKFSKNIKSKLYHIENSKTIESKKRWLIMMQDLPCVQIQLFLSLVVKVIKS